MINGRKARSLNIISCRWQKPTSRDRHYFTRKGLNIPEIANLLRKCGNEKDLIQGKHIHDHIMQQGLKGHIFLGNLLVQMYGKCGLLLDARQVFDNMIDRNLYSWNIMFSVYAQHGHLKEAFQLFQQMPQRNVVSWNAMLGMYAQLGHIDRALQLFKQIPQRNAISWNIMVMAYSQQGCFKEALQLFQQIPEKNAVSWNIMISVHMMQGQLREAFELFKQMPQQNLVSWTIMVAGYAQHGDLKTAMQLFQQMPKHDLVSWTTMISAYAQQGHIKQALQLFEQMSSKGMMPDNVTFITMIDACTRTGALAKGKWLHSQILDRPFKSDVILQTSLINMYAKSGNLRDARTVFDEMLKRNVVSWATITAGYAHHGYGRIALKIIQQMHLEGLTFDNVTFCHILSACSHAGLVDEGCHCFLSLSGDHAITPILEHCNSVIDLLGRIEWLDVAEAVLGNMPLEPGHASWTALLGSCKTHIDVERGKRASEHVSNLSPGSPASYVLLSHIYAAAGQGCKT